MCHVPEVLPFFWKRVENPFKKAKLRHFWWESVVTFFEFQNVAHHRSLPWSEFNCKLNAKRATRCAKFLVRSRLNLKSCTVSVRHFVSDHSRTQFVSWLCDTFCVRPGSDLKCFTLLKPKLTSPTDGVGCTLIFANLPFSFSWFADTKPIRLEIYLKFSRCYIFSLIWDILKMIHRPGCATIIVW